MKDEAAAPHLAEASDGPRAARGKMRRWLVSYPRAVPLAIFIAIAAITALSVFAMESNARAREEAQTREVAQAIASALERRANNFASYLRAGAALFSTTQNVKPDTFQQFVSELRLDLDYRGSEGIGWVTVLPARDAAGFVERQSLEQPGYPGLRPPLNADAEIVAPVTYLFPDTKRNRRALGFDMYSEPVREAAMGEAQRTVQPTASARIVLAQEGAGDAPGFVIFMPVFRQIPGGNRVDRALAGFVYSPFSASRFLDAAMERVALQSYGVRLYDGTAQTGHLLVAHSLSDGGGTRVEQPVTVANRQLLLVVEAPEGATLDTLSMTTLVFGLTLGSLLMLLARLLTQQAFEDQARLAFFEEQHSIRNSLTRELNHRVKNTLANVLSIMSLTRRRSNDLDDFADSLEGRIRALSATHDLLTGTDWGTTPLRSVIEAELQHFRAGGEHIVNIDGPPVELAPNDALSFGLAVHELATNAAKFGALSVPEGRVSIYWTLVDDKMVEVEWREHEGPEVQSERTRGFGTELIEKIVAHELNHPVLLEFEREGVRCVMRVPVRSRRGFQIRQDA
ncbi:MAG: CHASE domain-containing protein [Erythrobacter sp.]|uniref:CHASE domain-containing protein n=1 Tax=Erythrobacter sp. TaxID=1042 RepID=UPI00261DAEE3|nr:CHASE domain-containing protein [Erythrobacter sp.]MDJ0979241.1 CHASE domain-containing protein [Erythrobacter sp.]